jgi:hypothetical protein
MLRAAGRAAQVVRLDAVQRDQDLDVRLDAALVGDVVAVALADMLRR